jgi:hypothetical protein
MELSKQWGDPSPFMIERGKTSYDMDNDDICFTCCSNNHKHVMTAKEILNLRKMSNIVPCPVCRLENKYISNDKDRLIGEDAIFKDEDLNKTDKITENIDEEDVKKEFIHDDYDDEISKDMELDDEISVEEGTTKDETEESSDNKNDKSQKIKNEYIIEKDNKEKNNTLSIENLNDKEINMIETEDKSDEIDIDLSSILPPPGDDKEDINIMYDKLKQDLQTNLDIITEEVGFNPFTDFEIINNNDKFDIKAKCNLCGNTIHFNNPEEVKYMVGYEDSNEENGAKYFNCPHCIKSLRESGKSYINNAFRERIENILKRRGYKLVDEKDAQYQSPKEHIFLVNNIKGSDDFEKMYVGRICDILETFCKDDKLNFEMVGYERDKDSPPFKEYSKEEDIETEDDIGDNTEEDNIQEETTTDNIEETENIIENDEGGDTDEEEEVEVPSEEDDSDEEENKEDNDIEIEDETEITVPPDEEEIEIEDDFIPDEDSIETTSNEEIINDETSDQAESNNNKSLEETDEISLEDYQKMIIDGETFYFDKNGQIIDINVKKK